MKVLIIPYTHNRLKVANQIANTINGCIQIIQAPPNSAEYWSFLVTEANKFGADYIIEIGNSSNYKYRNVNDIFKSYRRKGSFKPRH